MLLSTSSRETLRFSGNKIHCYPRDQSLSVNCYKIIRIVRALSLVNSCVKMRVWKHGCDITQLCYDWLCVAEARFDWRVGNMSAYQENLF